MQPGSKGRSALELRQLLPNPDKDILDRIFRLVDAHQPARQAMDPGQVTAVESFKGSRIPRRGERDFVQLRRGLKPW